MSAIAQESGNSHAKVRSKKMSTHIDMTPMVDLAFLLLTFFILTTKLQQPYALRIDMPVDEDISVAPIVNANSVLTLVMAGNNKIYWYTGTEPVVNVTNYSTHGLRSLIIEKNKSIKNMIVLIKSTNDSRYANLVDMFDELMISKAARYFLVDITPEDLDLIRASGL